MNLLKDLQNKVPLNISSFGKGGIFLESSNNSVRGSPLFHDTRVKIVSGANTLPKLKKLSNPLLRDLNLSHLTEDERTQIFEVMQRASQSSAGINDEILAIDKKSRAKLSKPTTMDLPKESAPIPFVVPSLEISKSKMPAINTTTSTSRILPQPVATITTMAISSSSNAAILTNSSTTTTTSLSINHRQTDNIIDSVRGQAKMTLETELGPTLKLQASNSQCFLTEDSLMIEPVMCNLKDCCQCHNSINEKSVNKSDYCRDQPFICMKCQRNMCKECAQESDKIGSPTVLICRECRNKDDQAKVPQIKATVKTSEPVESHHQNNEKQYKNDLSESEMSTLLQKASHQEKDLELVDDVIIMEEIPKNTLANSRLTKQPAAVHLLSPLPRSKTIDFSRISEYLNGSWDFGTTQAITDEIPHVPTSDINIVKIQSDLMKIDDLSDSSCDAHQTREETQRLLDEQKKGAEKTSGVDNTNKNEVIHKQKAHPKISEIFVKSLINKSFDLHNTTAPSYQSQSTAIKSSHDVFEEDVNIAQNNVEEINRISETEITAPSIVDPLLSPHSKVDTDIDISDGFNNFKAQPTMQLSESAEGNDLPKDPMACYEQLKEKLKLMTNKAEIPDDLNTPPNEIIQDGEITGSTYEMETIDFLDMGSDVFVLLNYLLKILAAKVSAKQTKIVAGPEDMNESNYFSASSNVKKDDSFIANTLKYITNNVNQSNYNQLLELISGLDLLDRDNLAIQSATFQKVGNRSRTLLKTFLPPLEKDLKYTHKKYGFCDETKGNMSINNQKIGLQIEKCLRHKLVAELKSALNSNFLTAVDPGKSSGDMNDILTSFSRLLAHQIKTLPKTPKDDFDLEREKVSPELNLSFRNRFDGKIRDRLRMTNKMLKHIMETQKDDTPSLADDKIVTASDRTSDTESNAQSEEIFSKLDATTGLAMMEIKALEEKKRAIKAEIARRKNAVLSEQSVAPMAKFAPSKTHSSDDIKYRYPSHVMGHFPVRTNYDALRNSFNTSTDTKNKGRSVHDLRPIGIEACNFRPSPNNFNYSNYNFVDYAQGHNMATRYNSTSTKEGDRRFNNLVHSTAHRNRYDGDFIEHVHDSVLPDVVLSQNLKRDSDDSLRSLQTATLPVVKSNAKIHLQANKQLENPEYNINRERKSLDFTSDPKFQQLSSHKKSIKKVILYKDPIFKDKENENYGIKIIGGQTVGRAGNDDELGAYVIKVNKGGLNKESLEQIQFGDKIVLWNGTFMSGKSFKEVKDIVKKSPQKVELILEGTVAADYPSTLTSIKESYDENSVKSINKILQGDHNIYNYYFSLPYQAIINFEKNQQKSNLRGEIQVQMYFNKEAKMLTITVCKVNLFQPIIDNVNQEPFVTIRLLPLASPSHIKQTHTLDDSDLKSLEWFQTFMFQNVTQASVTNKYLDCSLWLRNVPVENRAMNDGEFNETLLGCAIIPLKEEAYLDHRKHWFNLYFPKETLSQSSQSSLKETFETQPWKSDTVVKAGGAVNLMQNADIKLDENSQSYCHNQNAERNLSTSSVSWKQP